MCCIPLPPGRFPSNLQHVLSNATPYLKQYYRSFFSVIRFHAKDLLEPSAPAESQVALVRSAQTALYLRLLDAAQVNAALIKVFTSTYVHEANKTTKDILGSVEDELRNLKNHWIRLRMGRCYRKESQQDICMI